MQTETGHMPNRVYVDGDGDLHRNGAVEWDNADAALAERVTMVPAANGANVCEVTMTVKDGRGNTIARVHQFDIYLSDDADGEGHTATTASGNVTNKTSSGLVVNTQVAKKALTVQTLKTGVFILSITDTSKTAFKVCAVIPGTGKTVVGVTLATGNYG